MNTDSQNNNRIAKLVCHVLNTKAHLAEKGNRKGKFAMLKWGPSKVNHIYVDDQQLVVFIHRPHEAPVHWAVSMRDLEKNETPLLSATNSLLLASAKAVLDSVIAEPDERFLIAELEALVASKP